MIALPDVRYHPLILEAHDCMHGIEADVVCSSRSALHIGRSDFIAGLQQISQLPDLLHLASYPLHECVALGCEAKVLLHMRGLLRSVREFRQWILSVLLTVEPVVAFSCHHVRLVQQYRQMFEADMDRSSVSELVGDFPSCDLRSLDCAHDAVHDVSICPAIIAQDQNGERVLRVSLNLVVRAMDRLFHKLHIEARPTMEYPGEAHSHEVFARFIDNAAAIFTCVSDIRSWLKHAFSSVQPLDQELLHTAQAFDDAIEWRE